MKLLELIALSLGLAPNKFREHFKDQTSFFRLNHYPPCPSPHLALGVGRHKDSGCLTVLAQDDVGGLEVKRKSDGEWVRVKPTPNAYIINVADIIQLLYVDTCTCQCVNVFMSNIQYKIITFTVYEKYLSIFFW